jgi:hypothetical protein
LGVSYDSLKQRVRGTKARRKGLKGSAATFVELGAPVPLGVLVQRISVPGNEAFPAPMEHTSTTPKMDQ